MFARLTLLLWGMLFTIEVMAQSPKKGAEHHLEVATILLASSMVDSAYHHVRVVLDGNKYVPDEATFIFGKIMLLKGNHTQARDAIQKYLDLTGTSGRYRLEAIELLASAKEHICSKCDNKGAYMSVESCVRCTGSGKVSDLCNACTGKSLTLCPSCEGRGLNVKNKGIGGQFASCGMCEGKGFTDCGRCKGKGAVNIICYLCSGKGKVNVVEQCQH